MGFPRILSKNNKVYTKLGEFCLASDGHLWIVCHTCQEELNTQDQFFKHIQDEHNFLLGLKHDHSRNVAVAAAAASNFMEAAEAAAALMPLPLHYRKVNEEEQRSAAGIIAEEEQDSLGKQEPKDYTEMRAAMEPNVLNASVDIKVEPTSLAQVSLPPPPTLYQLPAVSTAAGGVYPAIVQPQQPHTPTAVVATTTGNLPLTMPPMVTLSPVVPAGGISGGGAPLTVASAIPYDHIPKESTSTTASASSAVSSDDGERWYICDYETCKLKFKYQSRLELHRSVHSKERRFACELCGASFKQSCNLSTHRKKKHFLKGSKNIVQPQRF